MDYLNCSGSLIRECGVLMFIPLVFRDKFCLQKTNVQIFATFRVPTAEHKVCALHAPRSNRYIMVKCEGAVLSKI